MIEEKYKQRLAKLQQDSETAVAESEALVRSLRSQLSAKEDSLQQLTSRKKHM